ncbi:MAG: hypothetical protein HKN09_08235 [Saprospiraceae bacterium]|nr:hypothetical protein [Saprospiraceae bacterium]
MPFIDTQKVSVAREQNWFFDANIPLGYGLGSSGCLCAACYDNFGLVSGNHLEIKNDLATMEAFFHGTSSGLDPLTIYLNKPLHLKDGNIELVSRSVDTSRVLVLDSGIHRNAKSFIEVFKGRKSTDPVFREALQTLNKLNAQAIEGLLNKAMNFDVILEISAHQFKYFEPMIPASIKGLWRDGLSSGSYALKLSGAGGGGCFLVFKKEKETDLALEFPLISV